MRTIVPVVFVIFAIALNVLLAAQGGSTTGDDISSLLPYINIGLAGVGLLSFVKGWIVPGVTYKEALEREAKLREELATIRETLDAQVLPAIERARSAQILLKDFMERFSSLASERENRS